MNETKINKFKSTAENQQEYGLGFCKHANQNQKYPLG